MHHLKNIREKHETRMKHSPHETDSPYEMDQAHNAGDAQQPEDLEDAHGPHGARAALARDVGETGLRRGAKLCEVGGAGQNTILQVGPNHASEGSVPMDHKVRSWNGVEAGRRPRDPEEGSVCMMMTHLRIAHRTG